VFLYALSKNEAGAVGSFGLIGETVESAFSYRLPGDANLSGEVELKDFNLLKTNFGVGELWGHGNFDGDLDVDLVDFNILKDHFGESVPVAAPEPATLSLLLIGCAAVLIARKRLPKRA
jgi:hypothetical protein